MRRYDVVSGIFFILSIIGFALAAPILVQEKRQACVDVVYIPKDVMTVLGKRGGEEIVSLEKQLENLKYLIVDSSHAHVLSSSAPPGPDHGSTNVVQAPALNPAWSTAHLDPWVEPSGPSSSTAPKQGSWDDRLNTAWDDVFSNKGDDALHGPLYTPTSTGHGLDHELTGAHGKPVESSNGRDFKKMALEYFGLNRKPVGKPVEWSDAHASSSSAPPRPDHGSTNEVQAPTPNPAWSTANPDPLMEPSGPSSSTAPTQGSWEDRFNAAWDDVFSNKVDGALHGPLYTPTSTGHGLDHELTGAHKNPVGSSDARELEKLVEKYFNNMGKPVESSDAHASSSSAPPGTDHRSTNVVQAPAPNPASSTANPDPLMEPSGPSSSTAPKQGLWEDRFNVAWDDVFSNKGDGALHGPLYTPTSTGHGLDHELIGAHGKPVEWSDAHALSSSASPGTDHGSTNVMQAPAPNPTANSDPLMEPSGTSSSTAPKQGSWVDRFNAAWDDVFSNKGDDALHGPLYTPTSTGHGLDHELTGAHAPQPNTKKRPLTDWKYWMNYDFQRPPKEFGQAHENQVEHVQQPNPGQSTDSNSGWNHWMNYEDPLSPTRRPAPPEEFGQAHVNQVEHVQQPNPGPSTDLDTDWNHWMNYEYTWSPTRRSVPPKEFGQAHEKPDQQT